MQMDIIPLLAALNSQPLIVQHRVVRCTSNIEKELVCFGRDFLWSPRCDVTWQQLFWASSLDVTLTFKYSSKVDLVSSGLRITTTDRVQYNYHGLGFLTKAAFFGGGIGILQEDQAVSILYPTVLTFQLVGLAVYIDVAEQRPGQPRKCLAQR